MVKKDHQKFSSPEEKKNICEVLVGKTATFFMVVKKGHKIFFISSFFFYLRGVGRENSDRSARGVAGIRQLMRQLGAEGRVLEASLAEAAALQP